MIHSNKENSMTLFHPVDNISVKKGNHKEHGTPILDLLSPSSKRCVGRAMDLAARKNKRKR